MKVHEMVRRVGTTTKSLRPNGIPIMSLAKSMEFLNVTNTKNKNGLDEENITAGKKGTLCVAGQRWLITWRIKYSTVHAWSFSLGVSAWSIIPV